MRKAWWVAAALGWVACSDEGGGKGDTTTATETVQAEVTTEIEGEVGTEAEVEGEVATEVAGEVGEVALEPPCLSATPSLFMAAVVAGHQDSRVVTLTACSNSAVTVTDITVEAVVGEGFSVDHTQFPLRIEPGAPLDVNVVYEPAEAGPYDVHKTPINDTAVLHIVSDAANGAVETTIGGDSVTQAEFDTPTAIIESAEGWRVLPGTTLHLDAHYSWTSLGTISSYQWSVAPPAGASSAFASAPSDSQRTYVAAVPGVYTFTLTVTDSSGRKGTGDFEVVVPVQEGLRFELTWDTPLDSDQHDEGPTAGADLDLHVTHPLASGPDLDGDGAPDPWFDSVFDAWWFTTNPDWGVLGDATDNPQLVRDDVDGLGPEVIALPIPSGETCYEVGVHYWADHGFGTSTATLRILSFGELVKEIVSPVLAGKSMWDVGKICWSLDAKAAFTQTGVCSGTTHRCEENGDCTQGATCVPRVAPDYENPAFPLP